MTAIALLVAALAAGPGPVAFVGVTVEDSDGGRRENVTVVINDGRILSVGDAAPPKGAQVIAGQGKVLTPGLIESLTQLGLVEIGLEPATHDVSYDDGTAVPGFRAADAINPLTARIPIARAGGITSVVTSPDGTLLYGAGAWLDLTGDLAGAPDPDHPVAMFGGISGRAADEAYGSRGGMWLHLREIFDDARFLRDHQRAFDAGASRELSLAPLHLEALWPVIDRELPLVLELQRASDIAAALRFAAAQRVRLVVAGGAEAWMVAEELASAGVPVILKPSDQLPWSFDMLAARDDALTLLHRAGVELIITTADWDNNVRRLRQEAGIACAHGLPRAAALRAITLAPATIFGRDDVGSVTPGKRANLVLWSGDPFELDSTPVGVWIDGVPQTMDTRQRQLAERYVRKLGLTPQP